MRTTGLILFAASAAWSALARAVVIDFEDIDLGFNNPLSVGPSLALPNVGNSGVTVTIVGGQPDLRIFDLSFADGATGKALIDYIEPSTTPHVTTILFNQPVANFQMSAGDLGGDEDTPLAITAYDIGDNALGSDSATWGPEQMPPFATLSVNASGIRKIVYRSGGTLPNSTFIDDLTFTPVPEPTASILLSSVAVGAGAFRGRRRRRRI